MTFARANDEAEDTKIRQIALQGNVRTELAQAFTKGAANIIAGIPPNRVIEQRGDAEHPKKGPSSFGLANH